MARKSDSHIAPADVRGIPMMVCLGGPNHGAVYFVDHGSNSWAERVRLAKALLRPDEDARKDRTLGYVQTEEKVNHPKWPDERVRVHRWGGDRG